jgi:hypothetical protein
MTTFSSQSRPLMTCDLSLALAIERDLSSFECATNMRTQNADYVLHREEVVGVGWGLTE